MVRKYLLLETTKAIVHALIISRLDYCNSLLYHLPLQSLKKLHVVMNAEALLVTLTQTDQRATQALKKLHWLQIKSRIDLKILSITYKTLNNQAPPYICELLVPYVSCRKLRSADQFQLRITKCNLKYGERSFSNTALRLWNEIPVVIKRAQSYQCFKKMLKTYLSIRL